MSVFAIRRHVIEKEIPLPNTTRGINVSINAIDNEALLRTFAPKIEIVVRVINFSNNLECNDVLRYIHRAEQ